MIYLVMASVVKFTTVNIVRVPFVGNLRIVVSVFNPNMDQWTMCIYAKPLFVPKRVIKLARGVQVAN
jgi:hypothetical protein